MSRRTKQPQTTPRPRARFVPAHSAARILGNPLDRFVILEQGHGVWVRGRRMRRVWRSH